MNATPSHSVDTHPPAHQEESAIGVVMPHAIGDSMYILVLLRNLLRAGHRLELVGGIIHPLRDWFPYAHFVPDPAPGQVQASLSRFPQLIQMFPRNISGELAPRQNLLSLIDLPAFKQRAHVLESMLTIAVTDFGLDRAKLIEENGIQPPAHLVYRRHENRLVIHPTASNTFKTWRASGFIRLAEKLRQRGLEPWFVVPPEEAAIWRARLGATSAIQIAAFDHLDDLAAFIYESGWFIGNDSGIGHLASTLGVPTLSLFPRSGLARRWRPAFGETEVVLPLPWLVTTALKERFWRPLLPVSRVLKAFERLQARHRAKQ